jgi:hypothetical protein
MRRLARGPDRGSGIDSKSNAAGADAGSLLSGTP